MGLALFFGQFKSVNNDTHGTYFIFVALEHFVQGRVALEVIDLAITADSLENVVLGQAFTRRNERKNEAEKAILFLD